eukprot:3288679-Amphidinium_carterae.1
MSRVAGDQLLLRQRGMLASCWHMLVLMAEDTIGLGILTPDGDIYEEDVGPESDGCHPDETWIFLLGG